VGPVQVGDDARRKVATRTGDSKWISGEESRDSHIGLARGGRRGVVGIGTALADDPQLHGAPERAARRAAGAAAAGRVRLRLLACPSSRSWWPRPPRSRSRSSSLARPPTPTPRRSRRPACRYSWRPAKRARARPLGARPAGRDRDQLRAPGGRPAPRRRLPGRRGDRRNPDCSWRPCCSAAAPHATRWGEGVERIAEAMRCADDDLRGDSARIF